MTTQNQNGNTSNNALPDVVTATGKLSLQIPLYALKSPHNLSFDLSLLYKSNMLEKQYDTWSPEYNSGIIATGWSTSCMMKIIQLSTEPEIFWLQYLDGLYELKKKEITDSYVLYKTRSSSNLIIKYFTELNYWTVTGIDGNVYYFGKNDSLTNEEGTYSPTTGTYTNASQEYTKIRELISDVQNGQPANTAADNTVCATNETSVVWDNGWIGPSTDVEKQRQITTCWHLSHIEDAFENVLAFSYIQHISNVCASQGTKTYTVASYLYRIRLFVRQVEAEAVVFSYSLKDTSEYFIDLTLFERPNGMQQKFEKLHMDSVIHRVAGAVTDHIDLDTFLVTPTASIEGETLSRRQLRALKYYYADGTDAQYRPGYQMYYYGEEDGVKVGAAGFDDTHLYHNSQNGALYGNLKTLVCPSGIKKEFEYSEMTLSNIDMSLDVPLETGETAPEVIHTPYDYSIVIRKTTTTSYFSVATWTSAGWKYQDLLTVSTSASIDHEKLVSYSPHLIGLIGPNRQSFFVYTRDTDEEGVWSNTPFFESAGYDNRVNGPDNKLAIAVDDTGVAISSLLATQGTDQVGYVWFYSTSDNGKTFVQKGYQSLQNLMGSTNDYHVILKVADGRCFVFGLIKMVEQIRPETWTPPSWVTQYPDIHHYSLSIGMMDTESTEMTIQQLGPVPYMVHKHAWDSSTAWYKGLVCIGGKVTKTLRVDQSAQAYSIRVKTKLQWAKYWYSDWSLQQGESEDMFWGIDLLYDPESKVFRFLVNSGNIEERMIDQEPISLDSMEVMSCSSQSSRNGSIYQYYYKCREDISTAFDYYGTIYETYNGNTVTRQEDITTKNLLCIMKDDVFAVFETLNTEGTASQKTYQYYNQSTCSWQPISTGTISQQSVTYNEGAATALKVLEYLGMALFVVLLPLGLASAAGLMLTILNISLMISTYIAEAVLNNSARATLNPSCAFMGNRFLNDGTTIWFRNSNQSTLTAIGSGTASQPYDSLSDTSIQGNIDPQKQQYGVVYDYIPFQTDMNRIYYRRLKNNAVGVPRAIGAISNGCNDIYTDGTKYYAYAGKYLYTFTNQGVLESQQLISSVHPYFSSVDACVSWENGFGGNGRKLLTVSGTQCCMTYSGVTTPPEEISRVFQGTEFSFVDAMLEKPVSGANSVQFYLFSGYRYELVTLDSSGFHVSERGSLQQYSSSFDFKKISAACLWGDNATLYIFDSTYLIKNNSTGADIETGKLGSNRFYEVFAKDSSKVTFAGQTLAVSKTGDSLKIYRHEGEQLGGLGKDYVVSMVKVSPSPNTNDAYATLYSYDTKNATYIAEIDSGIYKRTFLGRE